MLVAVALIAASAAWVGYNLHWIKQRRQFADGAEPVWRFPNRKSTAPGMLWMFGEENVGECTILVGGDHGDVESLKRHLENIFPEEGWVLVTAEKDGSFTEHARLNSNVLPQH